MVCRTTRRIGRFAALSLLLGASLALGACSAGGRMRGCYEPCIAVAPCEPCYDPCCDPCAEVPAEAPAPVKVAEASEAPPAPPAPVVEPAVAEVAVAEAPPAPELSAAPAADVAGPQGPAAPSTPAAAATGGTLYDRLGGEQGMRTLIEAFMRKMATDSRVMSNPLVKRSLKKTSLLTLRDHLIAQLTCAAGGPGQYTGRDMKTCHYGLGISAYEWKSSIEDLVAAMDGQGIPDKEQRELLAIIRPMKADIVEIN